MHLNEVWDNCGQTNSDRLEKVQLEAVRIVTGITIVCQYTFYLYRDGVGKVEN